MMSRIEELQLRKLLGKILDHQGMEERMVKETRSSRHQRNPGVAGPQAAEKSNSH